jgi:hypothetical protein
MPLLWRFSHLKENNVVQSRMQLLRLQQRHGFPKGRLLSPGCRAWTVEEVTTWLESRPVEPTLPLRGAVKAKRDRRLQREAAAANSTKPSQP